LRWVAALAAIVACCAIPAQAAPFVIDGDVGLSSLIALSDGHLGTMAGTLEAIAATPDVQTARWDAVKGPLRQAAALNVSAIVTFARPDGSYWVLGSGKQSANIADRDYFRTAMSGQTVIGELVVSRTTGRQAAVVAVPIRNVAGTVVGILGASIFLDDLSARLKREMGIGSNVIFWAIDGTGKIAIHSDASNIFAEPGKMSPALANVRDEMLSHDGGTITYEYRGAQRTVIYRKSAISNWRYGFGIVH